jgi:hypothetical protein
MFEGKQVKKLGKVYSKKLFLKTPLATDDYRQQHTV